MSEEQETLGSYLRRERKKRDVSIEQIAYATRISLKMLNALEEDHHQLLPAQPFVRGYLQAYAKYVSLDPKDAYNIHENVFKKRVLASGGNYLELYGVIKPIRH